MISLKSIHYLIITLLVSIIISVGCDTSESTDSGDLVGTWRLTSMSMTYQGMTFQIPQDEMMQQTLVINADGTFTATGIDDEGSFSESGTWSTSGNVLTVVSPLESPMTFEYSVSGNTLTLTGDMIEEGETISMTLTYTRQ